MPNMADIVVKKNDGTTDITYSALTPSAGDKTPARWSSNTVSTKASLRPTFTMSSRFNGGSTARHASCVGKYPSYVTVSGVDSLLGNTIFNLEAVVPLQLPDSDIAEAISQFTNLVKSTLLQACLKAGYAPQ
jgi:hypothetical protein